MHKINDGIPPTNITHCILVQTSTSNRFQRQHCEKMQTKPSTLSMVVHGRRVPFQLHPYRFTRLRNVNARKSKQKKDIWFQRKKGMVHITMFKTLPNIQGHNGVNWSRKTIRHGTIQTSCHYNPPLDSCRQNSGSSTTVRKRNQTTVQKGSNGQTSCNRAPQKGTSGKKKRKTPPQQHLIIKNKQHCPRPRDVFQQSSNKKQNIISTRQTRWPHIMLGSKRNIIHPRLKNQQ